MEKTPEMLFGERLMRMNSAIAMQETDRVPFAPFYSSYPERRMGSSYRDIFYDRRKAGEACIEFYKKFPADAGVGLQVFSGPAQEIARPKIIDWPGMPGTVISDYSSHQIHEYEFIQPEEYRELIDHFDHFILTRYIPRVFDGLQGLSKIPPFAPATVMCSNDILSGLYNPEVLEALENIIKIAKHDQEAAAIGNEISMQLGAIGIPPYITGGGEVPFDVISDYFRGTIGAMTDLFEYEDEILELCDLIADRMIASWQYFRFAPLPVKRVFFPLHKGMDGFMSPDQFERVYWKPFRKLIDFLVSIDVQPFIYTEGKYDTRLEQMDLPAGKCLVHFENVDMKRAKETVGKTSCISGNLSGSLLEFGTREQVVEQTKYLIDTCAPGGGYVFDLDICLENAKDENFDAMYETVMTYGSR